MPVVRGCLEAHCRKSGGNITNDFDSSKDLRGGNRNAKRRAKNGTIIILTNNNRIPAPPPWHFSTLVGMGETMRRIALLRPAIFAHLISCLVPRTFTYSLELKNDGRRESNLGFWLHHLLPQTPKSPERAHKAVDVRAGRRGAAFLYGIRSERATGTPARARLASLNELHVHEIAYYGCVVLTIPLWYHSGNSTRCGT